MASMEQNYRKIINLTLIVIIFLLIIWWMITQITADITVFERNLILVFINGLAFSMILFLMVSGFYLIFGLADIINFAHGAFFMLGGFIGFTSYVTFENFFLQSKIFMTNEYFYSFLCFILAMISTAILMGILGGVIEFTTIRRLYKKPLNQILLTVGISFVIIQFAQLIWSSQKTYIIPLNTSTNYFFVTGFTNVTSNITFETYSFVIIFIGLLLAIIMYVIFSKTKIGFLVQAAIEDSEMTEILGTNVKLMLSLVFIIGTILAGLAGFILVPSIHGGAYLDNATTYLIFAFVIVVVGGAHYGKFEGTFFGSLIIGFSYKFTETFFSDYTSIVAFIIMAIILIFRPSGLTGQAE